MIATLEQLKAYLGITGTSQDVILNILLNASNQMIETYIGRKIPADDYIEIINWNAQNEIVLKNYPVNTLTSIEVWWWDDFEEISKWFVLEEKIWRIFFSHPIQRGFQNYKITYNGGYTEIPADLTLASLKLASKYYNTRTSDWIKWESVNWDSLSFDVSEIPNDILVILNNYRDYEV